ncbi:MAG: histidine kinase, partial [Bacteroidota bacterium]
QVLQAQMNPHFMFNALGGIQNYILKSEKIEAYNYLGKFASLLRIIANYAANVHIELEREVEFINTYLELEKLRFREDFDYTLEVDERLKNGNYNIPSIVIQPIVENAMIHGLAGLERKGYLRVDIRPFQDGIMCVVTDNGRGRKAAEEIGRRTRQTKHLSIASVNTKNRLAFLRKIGYENAKLEVEDLYQNGEAAGTKVTIYLPFMYKENFVAP